MCWSAFAWAFSEVPTAEKTLLVTEFHQRFSPKYYALALHEVEKYQPEYVESIKTAESVHSYLISSVTRATGFLHTTYKALRRFYISKGKERYFDYKEFFALFKKHPRFNFVMNDREFVFTYTSFWPWSDLKSKHVILADTSPQLRGAGEVYLHEHDGVSELVLENNSGSYCPSPQHLLGMVRALRAELAMGNDAQYAIKMHPLHFADPEEKQKFLREFAQEIAHAR
jgi:hypothetical protein